MPRTLHPMFAVLLLLAGASGVRAGALQGRLPRGLEAVVWIDEVPDRVERHLTGQEFRWFWERKPEPVAVPLLVLRTGGWRPRVIVLAAGDSLAIENPDHVWHGAFSVSPAGAFDLGKRAPRSRVTVLLSRAGVIALRCDIHPDESSFVVVTPNHVFAHTDGSGVWRLPELPEGRYLLRARSANGRQIQRVVSVPARGSADVPLAL